MEAAGPTALGAHGETVLYRFPQTLCILCLGRISNDNYVPHGLKVVQCHSQGGLRSLMQLESRWRQHFLDSMQPKHLPQQWSVDHNHQKLLRKYGEDLPVKLW